MFGSSIYFATKVSVVVSFIFFILVWLMWNPEAYFSELSPLCHSFYVYSIFAVHIFFISFYLKFFKSEKRGGYYGGVSIILSFIILYFQYIYVKTSSPLVFIYGQDEPGIGVLNFFTLWVHSTFYFPYLADALFCDNFIYGQYPKNSYDMIPHDMIDMLIGIKDYLYSDYTIINGLDKGYHVDFTILFTNVLIHAFLSFWIADIFKEVKFGVIWVYKDYKTKR